MAFLKALLLLLIFFNHNEPFAMRKLKERYIKKFLLEKTDHPQNINSTLPLRKQLQLLPRLPASKHASFTTQDTESVTVKSAPINPSSPLGRPRHHRANLSEPSNHLQKHHSHHTKHHQPGLNHHHSNHSRTTHHHHRRFHMKTTKTHGSKKNGNKKHHKHDKNKHNKKNNKKNKNKIHKSRHNDKHQQKSPHLRHPTPNPAFLHLQILPDEIRNSTPSSPMPATFVRVGDFDGESRSDESGFKSEESGFKSESRFEDVESSDEMFRNEALKNEVQRDTEGEFEKDRPKVRFEGVREETRDNRDAEQEQKIDGGDEKEKEKKEKKDDFEGRWLEDFESDYSLPDSQLAESQVDEAFERRDTKVCPPPFEFYNPIQAPNPLNIPLPIHFSIQPFTSTSKPQQPKRPSQPTFQFFNVILEDEPATQHPTSSSTNPSLETPVFDTSPPSSSSPPSRLPTSSSPSSSSSSTSPPPTSPPSIELLSVPSSKVTSKTLSTTATTFPPMHHSVCGKHECSSDKECEEEDKICCFNGCAFVCVLPLQPAPYLDWLAKPKSRSQADDSWLLKGSEPVAKEEPCSVEPPSPGEDPLLCPHGFKCFVLQADYGVCIPVSKDEDF